MAASDQIRQMVNFILQEAHEKANEIRVKVSLKTIVGQRCVSPKILDGNQLRARFLNED
jgi:hypothetical protein